MKIPKNNSSNAETKQVDILINLVSVVELFHSPDGTAFADVMINNRRKTWQVRSESFRGWLVQQFYKKTNGCLSFEALESALSAIEKKARCEGPERRVIIGVGRFYGRLYSDPGNEEWRAFEISAIECQVDNKRPVRFNKAYCSFIFGMLRYIGIHPLIEFLMGFF